MLDMQQPEINVALQAVRRAAGLVKQIQAERAPQALTKGDRSPVTVADFASQAVVGRFLAEAFPGDILVAEEDSAALRAPEKADLLDQVTAYVARVYPGADAEQVCAWIDHGGSQPAGRYWTLDPIDGTKGFLRGDQYAVALALVEAGQVQLGVIGCPNLAAGSLAGTGSLAIARRGQGAWMAALDGEAVIEPLAVSGRQDPAQARLLRSFEAGHTNRDQVEALAQALMVTVPPVRMDSQAKYVVLAAGQGELYVRLLSPDKPGYREKIWDQAAGSLVVEEAGGQVTDLDGRPLDFSRGRTLAGNRGVLASNRRLHPQALDALQAVGA